jgi:fibro-slime domain-containing protein
MRALLLAVYAASLAACSVEARQGVIGVYEPAASADAGLPPPASPLFYLTMYLRDFKLYNAKDPSTNPAFDNVDSERSVVASALGPDNKPVYKAPANQLPTYGQALFDQWYRDTPGTNYTVVYPLPISATSDGQYEFDSGKSGVADTYQGVSRRVFFPMDDGGPFATPFGNQGAIHNQAFTAELHAVFTLAATGGTLRVESDDDAYAFINKKLVIDLGGTHVALAREIKLDSLDLSVGQEYPLDLFYAERFGATGALAITTSVELRPVLD